MNNQTKLASPMRTPLSDRTRRTPTPVPVRTMRSQSNTLVDQTRPQVFLADDDDAMCAMLAASLREKGFRVVEFPNGKELLMALYASEAPLNGLHLDASHHAPDLIISDLQMPGATGFDMLHTVQKQLGKIPVILITAFGDAQVHHRAKELGVFAVFDKPFVLADLHQSIERALQLGHPSKDGTNHTQ